MKEGTKLVKVYTGSEISAILLKGELDEVGIPALIKNNYQSGLSAGFVGGTPSAIDLYIQEVDLPAAEPFINAFIQDNIQ